MMFVKRFLRIIPLLILAVLLCAGCAGAESEPVEAVATEAPVEVTEAPAAEPVEEEAELPTPPDVDITSWEFLYAGINEGVGRYHPELNIWESQYMDARCLDETIAFMQAARDQGYTLWINCGYRNWEYRINWYERYINLYGSSYEAAKHVFPAGCSEHHTGLAFCITDESNLHANYNDEFDLDIQDTEVYAWMVEHCAEYGFIHRYPEGHEEHYGMACANAGHFRYVGVEAAEYITENNICFEEFLALYGKYKY